MDKINPNYTAVHFKFIIFCLEWFTCVCCDLELFSNWIGKILNSYQFHVLDELKHTHTILFFCYSSFSLLHCWFFFFQFSHSLTHIYCFFFLRPPHTQYNNQHLCNHNTLLLLPHYCSHYCCCCCCSYYCCHGYLIS